MLRQKVFSLYNFEIRWEIKRSMEKIYIASETLLKTILMDWILGGADEVYISLHRPN